MKKISVLLILMILLLLNCETVTVKAKNIEKYKDSGNIEVWILSAQEKTNSRKYKEAIEILNEILLKFPEQEILTINYNIGYNYYKLRNNNEALSYLNRVISLFENTAYSSNEIQENRKFVILAGLVLDRIEKDKKYRIDPYHVKDDLEEIRKKKPKRPKINE